jgi:polyisoprenoid-binding protein YceI
MTRTRISVKSAFAWLGVLGVAAALIAGTSSMRSVQAQGGPPPGGQAGGPPGQGGGRGPGGPGGPGGRQQAPPHPFPLTLTMTDGSTASYRVREQLAGISFPSDAVGTSNSLTGTIALTKDGSIDSAASKLTFDLKSLKSDQSMRDGFIQNRTLQSDQYPNAVFVPKTITGMPTPLNGQFGFQLTGDMTIHGVTAPVTWQGIATVDNNTGLVQGRAQTDFKFETFNLTVPQLARLLSVNDDIALEIEVHFKIS